MPHQSDESTIFMGGTPIYNLCKLFIDESIIMSNSIKYSSLESFFKSLDYGYLRDNVIDKYRFDQACDEVGIKMPDSIDGYIFK